MVADPGAEWAVCGECRARVKQANLERHYAQTHPGKKRKDVGVPGRSAYRVLLAFTGVYGMVAGTFIILLTFLARWGNVGGLFARTDAALTLVLFVLIVAIGMTLGAEK